MAPVLHHDHYQSRQVILPPRPAKGPPGGAKAVTSLINLRTFLMLLLGSFCIFILAVFIWKLGAFLRSFSRGKVVGGGKAASIRYAKTWHGWVPRNIHDNRMRIRKERLNRLRDKLAWRSSHADYSWVWWDPGGFKFHHHRQNQQRLRIVPPQLLSYRFKGPDIHQTDPEAPHSRSNSRIAETQKHSHRSNICSYLATRGSAIYKGVAEEKGELPPDFAHNSPSHPPNGIWTCAKRSLNALLPPLPFTYTINRPGNTLMRSRSLPDGGIGSFCASQALVSSNPRRFASEGQGGEDIRPRFFSPHPDAEKTSDISVPNAVWPKTNSWRFKAWGARMQRGALVNTPLYLRGLAGRPGTPVSGVLRGMISSATYSGLARYTDQSIYRMRQDRSSTDLVPKPCKGLPVLIDTQTGPNTEPDDRGERLIEEPHSSPCPGLRPNFGAGLQMSRPPLSRVKRSSSVRDMGKPRGEKERPPLRRHLSNPEIRLMDDLNRKLDWLACEMDPGRKPFHFAVCHNHWLNRATWVVLDPVSRVGIKTRRLYGDPRVNYPRRQSKEKTPIREHLPASPGVLMPNLNSWRLAVNGARKSAGAMEVLNIVELFDGSAEEVQDGAIDPASWVLKKPPQGYSLTRKQKDAYFEGCGGWCEKLDDWQQVSRAYRARRVICEGKANRRRVAEVADTVSRRCRKTARQITPIWLSSTKSEWTTERREKSGRGLIKRRMRTKGRAGKKEKVSHRSCLESVNQGSQYAAVTTESPAATEELDTG